VRPAENQLAFGLQSGRFGPVVLTASAVGRVLTDRYTVRYRGAAERTSGAAILHDPGSGNRGGDAQDVRLVARDPASLGQETYELTNARLPDVYGGLEVQVSTAAASWWYVSLGGAAYVSAGSAPFGTFADRNDPGAIDEASADANARVNQRGRYDHDRSFHLKLLAALEPLAGLWASAALRYRDGEPFTRYLAADEQPYGELPAGSLPQGPTQLAAVPRGRPRFTFTMTLDVRVAYDVDLGGTALRIGLDALNLLGSGTELLEDPRTGPTFRAPLEMVPGRAVFATASLGWR
jgi:hypothetical protein